MKVQIENQITAHNMQWVKDLNTIFAIAKASKTMLDLSNNLRGKKYQTLVYGFGGTHCWVKQMDMTCKINDERTLFITEK